MKGKGREKLGAVKGSLRRVALVCATAELAIRERRVGRNLAVETSSRSIRIARLSEYAERLLHAVPRPL